jgi:uncharacterized repeat protein (TIGR01451 family)
MGRLILAILVFALVASFASPGGGAAPAQRGLTCKYGFKYVVKIVHGHRKRVKVCKPKPKPKPQADLELELNAIPDSVTVGNHVAYTFVAENQGPAYADDVTIAVDLPAGENELYASGGSEEGASCDFTTEGGGTHVECHFGQLAPESQAEQVSQSPYAYVRVVVEPSTAGDVTAHAKITSSTADPHPENNEVSRPLHVMAGPASADLALALTAEPGATVPDGYTETVSVTNNGPTDATDIYATLLLPQGATVSVLPLAALIPFRFVPTGLCPPYVYSFISSSIVCFDSIASGETQSKTVRILPSVRPPSTLRTDGVVAAYTRDADLSNNRAFATTTVAPFTPQPGPDIRLSLVPPGTLKAGDISIPFRLENLGLSDLDGVDVSASVSPALTNPVLSLLAVSSTTECASTDTTTACHLGSIESDSRQVGVISGTAAAGTYTATVTVSSPGLSAPVSDKATFHVG